MEASSSLSWIQKSIYSALIFFATLLILSAGYAAYTWDSTGQASIRWKASGSTLTSSGWNALVNNVDYLKDTTDSLSNRFNSIPVNTLSGVISDTNLPFKKGQTVGDGSARINDATTNSTTSYYRVDSLAANKALIHPSVTWGVNNSQSGTMSIGGNVNISGGLSTTIPAGYYDGSKTANVIDGNLAAGNIKSGVSVLGVSGTYSGGGPVWRTYNGTSCVSTCTSYGGAIIWPNSATVTSCWGGAVWSDRWSPGTCWTYEGGGNRSPDSCLCKN